MPTPFGNLLTQLGAACSLRRMHRVIYFQPKVTYVGCLHSAFQTVAAASISGDTTTASEVLVCGNNVEARECVIGLVKSAGLKAWHAGPIDNSVVSESMTSILIFLNKHYQIHGAGIRIVKN